MKKRGISIISLSVMIVVMLIILSVVSVSLTYSITNAKKMTFAQEIYNIQSLVDEYIQREGVLPNVVESITITPSDITQFQGENFVNEKLNLDVLDIKQLDIKNTKYGNKTIGSNDTEKAKDVYAVSATTGRVYYIAGFKSGNKTYYTLTDELRQMVEKEQNISIGEKTITFTPSKVGWANEGVQVTAFVPTEFTSPSITIDNSNITYTESSNADGITYVVNSEKKFENYTITISYIKNGVAQTATYTTKLDNVVPVISKDSTITNTETHIKGLKATDAQSGIRLFKYAQGAINAADAKTYMNAYGKNLKNGSIKFSNKVVYTLYAEDKAGNYSVMYINKGGILVSDLKPAPTLAAKDTWYTAKTSKSTITTIDIIDIADESIIETASESFPAAEDTNGDGVNDDDIMGYINGTKLTIAGNGMGSIFMNPDSKSAFAKFTNTKTFSNSNLLDASKVNDMTTLFSQCTSLTSIDVSDWDTSNVVSMPALFQACISLKEVDLSKWDVSKVTTMQNMFYSNDSVGLMNITSIGDTSNWNTESLTNTSYMFYYCPKLTSVNTTNWNTSNISSMRSMFYNCYALTSIGDTTSWNTEKVTEMNYMFYACNSLKTLNVSNWNTANVNDMSSMFGDCSSLTSIGSTTNWDTSNVTDMSWMFDNCSSLEELDVSNWDMSKVTTINSMFSGGSNGANPFKPTLDVSNWDTSNITNMSFAFYSQKSGKTLDLRNWDTSKVTTFDHFMAHSGITLAGGQDAVKNWNTSSCTNMNAMFYTCRNTVLDLSNFNTSKVTIFDQMFEASGLKQIIGMDKWDTSSGLGFSEMFWNNTAIEEVDLSSFDTRKAKNNVTASGNGSKTSTLQGFFRDDATYGNKKLKKIILGENFSFNGDGTNTNESYKFKMPSVSAVGSDTYWQAEDGTIYAPSEVPDMTYGVYTAVPNPNA